MYENADDKTCTKLQTIASKSSIPYKISLKILFFVKYVQNLLLWKLSLLLFSILICVLSF